MKLTLRDLLWLALLVAGLTLWGIQHRRSAKQAEGLGQRAWFQSPGPGPSDAAIERKTTLRKLTTLSDQELDQRFATLITKGLSYHGAEYELCLTEMVRRRMVDALQKHYDAIMANVDAQSDFPYNLELLTALRRAQGKPDPLRIEISPAESKRPGFDDEGPLVQATITNVDAEQQSVHFTRGGDYRGGRRDRWRVVLMDDRGRAVRDSNYASMVGGGIASIGPFAFGETDRDGHVFDLRRYVAPFSSGKYRLQLLYHNQFDLASEPDVSGLIVTRSRPVDVVIEVPATKAVSAGVQALIAIMTAAAILTLAIIISNQLSKPRTTISRRDIVWNCLLLAVAVGAWQGDRYWHNKITSLQPDADASWSISFDS